MAELLDIARGDTAVRCGKTINPHARRGQYSREADYQDGTYKMFYCRTSHVHTSENKLLGIKEWERNVQTKSNAKDNGQGYVYVICRN